jgi:tetratricopeptide (TPR) repeat protein
MRHALALVTTLALSPLLGAAISLPQVSPAAAVMQEVGISRVKIHYHRPSVQSRKIWDGLVPYGKVWRLGANEATILELPHEALIDGNKVPAGKYSLFAIPGEKEWTFIVNKVSDQWGAYSYDPKQDVLRFKAKPEAAPHREYFDIDIVPVSERAMRVDVMWEKVRVPFTLWFDVDTIMWSAIDTALANPNRNWEDFHQAARYAQRTNKRLDDALNWVETSMRLNESFWNYELKGLILHQLGRDAEAIPAMQKARELAAGKAPQEWIDNVDKQIAEWKK